MIYTLNNIISSVAQMLRDHWPETTVYDARTMQGTRYPCFFIQLMPSSIEDGIAGRDMRRVSLDVVYVQQRNIPDANARLYDVADELDELLDMINYTDGAGNTALLHTNDRENTIEDQELHHKFTLSNRVQIDRPANIKIEQVEEFNTYVQESGD